MRSTASRHGLTPLAPPALLDHTPMYYLKMLRQYLFYSLVLLAMFVGSVYQANFGCADHVPAASGFEGVGPNDKVLYGLRSTRTDAFDYGDMVVYAPRVGRTDDIRGNVALGLLAGMPGDVVQIRDNQLVRNGTPVPNVITSEEPFPDTAPLTVPRDSLYVLAGAPNANDSRSRGPIPIVSVHGVATFVRP